ncbi:MAG TPA: glycosyltransferase family 4 protein [Armatimonadota bacterium]
MNLLLINYEYPPLGGGAGNATREIGRALASLGCGVTVLTTAQGDLPLEEEQDGVLVRRVRALRRRRDRSNPLEMLSFISAASRQVASLARERSVDRSLAFMGLPSGPVALELKRRLGIPYWTLLRGGDVPGFLPEQMALYHRLSGPWIQRVWHESEGLIANSVGLRRLAEASLHRAYSRQRRPPGAFALKLAVVPNGVDTGRFIPAQGGLPPRFGALFVGRLSAQKACDDLLAAWGALPRKQGTLTLVGDGPERAALQRQAAALHIADEVDFLGWRPKDELVRLYQGSSCLVLPSLCEGMPNVVLEAMACGLPVVATAVEGTEELVSEGRSGFLVPPSQPRALAEALSRLSQDPGSRQRLGEEGRRLAESRDWTSVARVLLRITCGRAAGGECPVPGDAQGRG